MTPAGAIIGQIQTSTQPTAMSVTPSPSQVPQLQPGTPQTITLSTPQQVPLPPSVPPVKLEQGETTGTADSATQGTATMIAETTKEAPGDGEFETLCFSMKNRNFQAFYKVSVKF